jgi:hypothetical protein
MEALNLITQNHNLPRTTNTHHQFKHTNNGKWFKCTMQLSLTPTTTSKARKTSRTHEIKKFNKMWIQNSQNQFEKKINKFKHFGKCVNPQTEQCENKKSTNPNNLKNAQTHKIEQCEAKSQQTQMICKVCKLMKSNNAKPKPTNPNNLQSVQTHETKQRT